MTATDVLVAIGSERAPILVRLNAFEGKHTLDIRRYFRPAGDTELRPTQKGVSLNQEAYAMFQNAIAQNHSAIEEWLAASGHPHVESVRQQIRARQEALEDIKAQPRPSKVVGGKWRSPEFFRVRADGPADELELNETHTLSQFVRRLEANERQSSVPGHGEPSAWFDLLAAILVAYNQARLLFDGVGQMTVRDAFETLEFNWGLILERALNKAKDDE